MVEKALPQDDLSALEFKLPYFLKSVYQQLSHHSRSLFTRGSARAKLKFLIIPAILRW